MTRTARDPIARTLDALVWFLESDKQHIGVRELAAAMNMSPSSAHRILAKLLDAGFISQDHESKRYELGMEFFRIAQLSEMKLPIRQVAVPAMRRLVNTVNETALLGIYDPARQEMFYAASVDSTHPLRYVIELNKWMPVYTGASGLAIMSFLTETETSRIIKRTKLAKVTVNSISDPDSLLAELARVRERGYAFTQGQRFLGAVGIAAPIFSGTGPVIGSVCVTIPEQRFNPEDEGKLVRELSKCTSEIADMTGAGKNFAS